MKSHASDQIELLRCIYLDACSKCAANSDLRDLITIESRVKTQGLSFLTISLPNFAKDFDKSLANGFIEPAAFRYFKKAGAIPAFLQGMLAQIFDRENGRLNEEFPLIANRHALVEAVRQICRAFVKVQMECTSARTRAAIEGFVKTERDLAEFSISPEKRSRFLEVSHHLWSECLSGFEPDTLVPKHGPGATAEGVTGNRKYLWRYWHERLEPYFPFLTYAYSISAYDEEEFKMVAFLEPQQELPVKVISVPKTQKGPRIIAVEPCCMQYAQQSVQKWLYARIEGSRLAGGHVNFRDQSVNQDLAIISSETGAFATLDLSEASDRVPYSLVKDMFLAALSDPTLWDAIDACRSVSAQLPDGRVIGPLLKFASMGSALCFPVEAMYFYTACVEALLEIRGLPVTARNVFLVSRSVFVYGDDLLVPTQEAAETLKHLAKYNCQVNLNKSFWTGKFRESCGADAYDGEEITPTYVRSLSPKGLRSASEIVSSVATARLFYKKGYWSAAEYLYRKVERILGRLPYTDDASAALGRFTFLGGRTVERWSARYHRFEVKGWVEVQEFSTDTLGGYAALQKSLLMLEGKRDSTIAPSKRDPLHLERTVRRGAATLKRRWVAI